MTRRTPRSARTSDRKPHGDVIVAAAMILATLVALWGALGWRDNPLTTPAAEYTRDVAAASAAVYVTLRTLNSFLSTAQGVEVGVKFFGSASANPLRFLEPVDDTVERIASAVFALMLLAGVLSVAMGPVGGLGWAMVALAAVLWLIGWGRSQVAGHTSEVGHRHGALGRHLLWYGVFLALALPAAFLLSGSLADWMTAEAWQTNQAVIVEITGEATEAARSDWTVTNIREKFEYYYDLSSRIYDRAGELVTSYIALLSIFIFKLFVLPLLLAGGFFVIARTLARGNAPSA